jgi:DNA-binding MarR family transcriptional regulator
LLKYARVMIPQASPKPVIEVGARRAALRIGGHVLARFDVLRVEVLTLARAQELLAGLAAGSEREVLVVFKRSSPDARALLRARPVSYAAGDGELFVCAPPVYVERPARKAAAPIDGARSAPFAVRASRVPRRLLLRPDERPTLRWLAQELQLSESVVSRTVAALAEDGLVQVERDPRDARVRHASLRDVAGTLDAFERATAARRVRRLTWDVGARDAEGALGVLHEAAPEAGRPYALGGLAGAALHRRVVEPAELTLWIEPDQAPRWEQALLATPARPAPGRIAAQLAPDPFTLTLARERNGLMVADPVQLYLDCRLGGERALDAAEAIREEQGW